MSIVSVSVNAGSIISVSVIVSVTEISLLTATKFGTIDYIHEGTPNPNLEQIHPLGASAHMGEYNVFCYFLYTFS